MVSHARPPACRGFTLIEAVIVIAITGIIASMVAVFIQRSVQSYIDTSRRAELTEAADVALRKLAREVRLAVPNSLRLTTSGGVAYLEFVPTKDGGRYRNEGDGSSSGNTLCSGGTLNATFDVLGVASGSAPPAAVNDYIVVFNDNNLNGSPCTTAPTDVYCGGSRAQVSAVANATGTSAATITTGAALANSIICSYANNRFQVVDQSVQTVTYACPTGTAGTMRRFWNYGFQSTQPTDQAAAPLTTGSSAIVVRNTTCAISYTPNAYQRNGVLSVTLTLTDGTGSGEQIVAFREIHVDNSP